MQTKKILRTEEHRTKKQLEKAIKENLSISEKYWGLDPKVRTTQRALIKAQADQAETKFKRLAQILPKAKGERRKKILRAMKYQEGLFKYAEEQKERIR